MPAFRSRIADCDTGLVSSDVRLVERAKSSLHLPVAQLDVVDSLLMAPLPAEFTSMRDGQRRVVAIGVRTDVSEQAVQDLWQSLDGVEWSNLHHAYGPAGDVPAQLFATSIGTDDPRALAWWELWGNIHHQGTVYEATLAAVPFIDAIAVWPGHPDRVEAIAFLRAIASPTAPSPGRSKMRCAHAQNACSRRSTRSPNLSVAL